MTYGNQVYASPHLVTVTTSPLLIILDPYKGSSKKSKFNSVLDIL